MSKHCEDCTFLGGVVDQCVCLKEAKKLLEAMDMRHDDRVSKGNMGEWQTEVNELRRIIGYLIAAR